MVEGLGFRVKGLWCRVQACCHARCAPADALLVVHVKYHGPA
jgi:hypothetical protein